MTREEFNYETYSKLVKTIWSEEFERLQEYIYCITAEYDGREDKHWVETPYQDIPDYEEMFKVITCFISQSGKNCYLGDLLHDELSGDDVECIESQLKQIWYSEIPSKTK